MESKRMMRKDVATAKMGKRLAFFGAPSPAGYAPAGLPPAAQAKQNEDMITYTAPAAAKAPLKKTPKARVSLGNTTKEGDTSSKSPQTPRASKHRDSSKQPVSVPAKLAQSRSKASMDVDEEDELAQDTIEEEKTESSPKHSPKADKMEVDEEDELDAPKNSRKRLRDAMTPPSGAAIRKKHSHRLIATKRTGSASSMEVMDDEGDEYVDTPKRSGKTRSRDRIVSPRNRSPVSPQSDRLVPSKSSKSLTNSEDNDEDSTLGAKPMKKKPKRREVLNPVPLVSESAPPSVPWSPMSSPTHVSPKPAKSLWEGFISRSIQKLRGIANTPTKRDIPASPSQHNQHSYRVESFSEPSLHGETREDQYADSIASPQFQSVSVSAPHGMGSPHRIQPSLQGPIASPIYTSLETPNSPLFVRHAGGYQRQPPMDFIRSSSTEDHIRGGPSSSDFISDSRSQSAGYLNSPHATHFHTAVGSPTAYLASASGTPSRDWSNQHTRSPRRTPRDANENWVIPMVVSGPPIHSPQPQQPTKHARRNSLDMERKPKKPIASLWTEIKKALKSFLFGVAVIFLLVLILWLYTGDSWRRFFSSDPELFNRMCSQKLKEVLRTRMGDFDCGLRSNPSMTNYEMDLLISSLCPYGRNGMNAEAVKKRILADLEVDVTSSTSFFYKGAYPIKPITCALKDGLINFARANAINLSIFSFICGLLGYFIFRIRRYLSDKALAKQISGQIIEQMKEELAKGGSDTFLVKDYMEDDYSKTTAQKRVWPQVVDLVEANIRVRTLPKLVHGDQLVVWAWS